MIELDDVNRQLLGLLDGHHTLSDMVNGLHQAVRDGTLKVHEGEKELTEPARLQEVLMRAVEELLPRLARSAFLEA
jgi:methyltransferase-like protein